MDELMRVHNISVWVGVGRGGGQGIHDFKVGALLFRGPPNNSKKLYGPLGPSRSLSSLGGAFHVLIS